MEKILESVRRRLPRSGIPLERVSNSLKKDLSKFSGVINHKYLCLCCKKFINGAHYCLTCRHYFCESCFLNQFNTNCQICKQDKISTDVPLKDLKELSYYMFKCPNERSGCRLKLFYEIYNDHVPFCGYEPLLCLYPDCKKRIIRKKYPEHIRKCSQKLIICKHCYEDQKFCEFNQHLLDCKQRIVECFGCNKQLKNKYLKNHLRICDMVDLICEKCGFEFNKKDMENHSDIDCFVHEMHRFEKFMFGAISGLRKEILKSSNKIDLYMKHSQQKCINCNRFSCEVALKTCHLCSNSYCSSCAKQTFMNCKFCNNIFCVKCSQNFKGEGKKGCVKCLVSRENNKEKFK